METVTISVNVCKSTCREVDIKKFVDIMIKENFIDNNMDAFYQFENNVVEETGTTNIASLDNETIKECLIETLMDTLTDYQCYEVYVNNYFQRECNDWGSVTCEGEANDDLIEAVEDYLKSADLSELIGFLKKKPNSL